MFLRSNQNVLIIESFPAELWATFKNQWEKQLAIEFLLQLSKENSLNLHPTIALHKGGTRLLKKGALAVLKVGEASQSLQTEQRHKSACETA